MNVNRPVPAASRFWVSCLLACILAACAAPTPPALPAGAFETALAATVEAGAVQVAQGFASNRATLTASAPTVTKTFTPSPTPTDTPTPVDTPTPTETPTLEPTPTDTVPPPTATRTLPPPPTATFTPSPVLPGTYVQNGVCIRNRAYGFYDAGWMIGTAGAGVYIICVPSVIVNQSNEIQINVTWQVIQEGLTGIEAPMTAVAVLPAYNGSVLYLEDNLGGRISHTALEGAARDGASGQHGNVFVGYYVFQPAQAGATTFTLVDTHRKLVIGNIRLAP